MVKQWKLIKTRSGKKVRRYVDILPSGKWKFLKTPKGGGKTNKGGGSSKSRGKSKMGRRTYKVPLGPSLGLAGTFAQPAISLLVDKNPVEAMKHTVALTGWNMWEERIDFMLALKKWAPFIGGLLIHKFIGGWPLNANRILGRYKLPFSI